MEILNCQDAIELDPRICVILNAEDVQAGNALGARTGNQKKFAKKLCNGWSMTRKLCAEAINSWKLNTEDLGEKTRWVQTRNVFWLPLGPEGQNSTTISQGQERENHLYKLVCGRGRLGYG